MPCVAHWHCDLPIGIWNNHKTWHSQCEVLCTGDGIFSPFNISVVALGRKFYICHIPTFIECYFQNPTKEHVWSKAMFAHVDQEWHAVCSHYCLLWHMVGSIFCCLLRIRIIICLQKRKGHYCVCVCVCVCVRVCVCLCVLKHTCSTLKMLHVM